ncbi:MAG: hypothetical protein JXA24_01215 [Proteobacteria bacterium]|nr:hypothetical protein [Pseudomonadota bacterium]
MVKMTRIQHDALDRIEKLIDRGILPEEVAEQIRIARSGDYDRNLIFKAFAKKYNRGDRIAVNWLMRELGGLPPQVRPASSSQEPYVVYDDDPARPIEHEAPELEPRLFRKRLDEMIWGLNRPQEYTPQRIVDSALKKLGVTKGMDGYEHGADAATRLLSKKMAFEIVSSLRRGRLDPLPIPPNPTSPAFDGFMSEKLLVDERMIREWKGWDGWPRTLVNVFAVVLGDGVSPWHAATLVERREQEITLKRRWYLDIDALGVRSQLGSAEIDVTGIESDSAGAIGRMYRRVEDADRIRRAKAEYARFDSTVHADAGYDGASVRDLYRDMLALHQDDLNLGAKSFLRLLMPFVLPMTPAEIEKAIHRQDVPDEVRRLTALTVLYWHTRSLHGLAGWLSRIVRDNKTCRTINAFCANRLGFSPGMIGRDRAAPPALMKKLEQMADAGVDLAPLINTLATMFAGSVPDRKAAELLKTAKEKRAKALPLDLKEPKAATTAGRRKRAKDNAVVRGNGPRRMKRKGTTGGDQLALDFGKTQDKGAAHYILSKRAAPIVPGAPAKMVLGAQLMLPGIAKPGR